MRAAFYDKTGPANEVLQVGEVPTPVAGPGEVRVKVQWSGVNPSDVKSRRGRRTSNPVGAARMIPHSDGSGVIDAVGDGVPTSRIGERVWTWNGAWRRVGIGAGSEAAAQVASLFHRTRGQSLIKVCSEASDDAREL